MSTYGGQTLYLRVPPPQRCFSLRPKLKQLKKNQLANSDYCESELLVGVAATVVVPSSFFLPSWSTYRPDLRILEG